MNGTIVLVGLGPGGEEGITPEALAALRDADAVLVRTGVHPGIKEALKRNGIDFETCDDLYEQSSGFDELYPAIVERVMALLGNRKSEIGNPSFDKLRMTHPSPGTRYPTPDTQDPTPETRHPRPETRSPSVAYAVPGHPLFGERTCKLLLERAKAEGIDVTVIGGKDFVSATLEAVAEPFNDHLQVVNAYDMAGIELDPRTPVLVYQVDCAESASEAKLALMKLFPDDHPVKLVTDGANPGAQSIVECELWEMDHQPLTPRTTAYVPPLALERAHGFAGLVQVIRQLRGPGGCPWDTAQTHESLKKYLLEESYETLDAIDSGDPDLLCDELGDILLQVVLHANIADEEGLFDVGDVVRVQTEKLLRRHPHVFGDVQVESVQDVLRNWETIKAGEKNGQRKSALDGVPSAMPSLLRAHELSNRAARLGFDWPNVDGVLDKVEEEVRELREAGTPEEVAHEVGDLLFAVANVARKAGLEPEEALRTMVNRFVTRFQSMETELGGRDPRELTPNEWEDLWLHAKQAKG